MNGNYISIDNKKGFKAKINWQYLNVGMEYAWSLFMVDADMMSFTN
ncbi:hypothetical protein [Commensalibacter nepenthis]|uniref:TonB-dependent receptor n=1 Tax=Commensalibacter nepenthis TaxID=3043872 RepID=A0ABT6Q8K3_9PROT|nr:hypothetical protein [Commensalibacter sp. TBRC 10068]MDI2113129.1 hypothetical protein [Commensalibacter sp. TBRC 10068]